ncbi:MAG: 16S rRNA (uracil(1498)-N(3))-methyltransferase [Betaproteobacteria bacterium]|nr:16S rRNA (uracil(1498)-N(3))-methyltransferase [Betaproteobacteria bacterium]
MNLPRFYCPFLSPDGAAVSVASSFSPPFPVLLPEAVVRHVVRVLRLSVGDSLILFDGSGGEFLARLVRIDKHSAIAELLEWSGRECESPLRLTLAQALSTGDKMDLTIQKAVELGVSKILPLQSRRSTLRLDEARAEKRLRHWQGVAASACEQCGRNRLPRIDPVMEFSAWLGEPAEDASLRLMLDPEAGTSLAELLPAAAITLLVGPEGGLTREEAESARSAGFIGIRLGPRTLRTETAGLAALAALQTLWGDFRQMESNARHCR